MGKGNPGSRTRALAAEAVHAVLHSGRSLDDALADAKLDTLEARDRAFVRALCFGTLRTHLRNRHLLGMLLEKPLRRRDRVVESLLSTAMHALVDLEMPEYAVVSATVDATEALDRRALRGLVNAILRRFVREADELLAAAASDEVARLQHPQWLIERVRHDWPDHWEAILEANNARAPLSIRVNTRRSTRADWLARLDAAGERRGLAVDGLRAAAVLDAPTDVDALPGFAQGDCSVQDASAQRAAEWLQPSSGMRVLDACAAPGGKTCHLLELADNALELTALDADAERLERLRENLLRLQLGAKVVVGDAAAPADWWDGVGFDRILLDPPCTGSGVIRRHPDIRHLRRPDDAAKLAQRQSAMLNALWPLLRPGGRLLYATCSILRAENEAVVSAFLETMPDATDRTMQCAGADGLHRASHGVYTLPGEHTGDGFYYALMERSAA